MCGILTYYDIKKRGIPESLNKGISVLKHRGPDAEGIYKDQEIFLGHRRLKIIDLSNAANQPMSCDNGRYRIVFNGEIYNFKEIKYFLESKGHKFYTHGDTEVLLKLYKELEEKCLEHLNGMFSFVIYDSYKKKIFAARDRLGIKPLYYFWDGQVLSISSEIKPFVVSNIIDRKIDLTAIEQYMIFGTVHSPRTIYESVKSLLPGHYLTLNNNHFNINKYWQIPFIPDSEKQTISMKDASEHVRDLLEDSVKLRTVSDVPLGAFLSGGIDSSVIVGLLSKLKSEVKTFSIGFDVGDNTYNETSYAKMIADLYNTDHNEIILTGNDINQEIPKFIKYIDQPSTDGFNSYFISKYTREQVTVSLSGLGGDEVFTGYTKSKFYHNLSSFRKHFPSPPSLFINSLQSLHDMLPIEIKKNRFLRGSLALLGLWSNPIDYYRQFRTLNSQSELNRLLIDNDNYKIDKKRLSFLDKLSPLDASAFFDIQFYMQNTLLRDIDVASMAHSLEVRVPFLDHRLLEYVVQLPSELRIKKGETKYLLTKSTSDLLPKDIIYRKKMGFSFPFGIWLMNSPLQKTMLDCFSSNGLKKRGIFDNQELDRILNTGLKQDSSKRPSFTHYKLWMLTVLELWLRETNAYI